MHITESTLENCQITIDVTCNLHSKINLRYLLIFHIPHNKCIQNNQKFSSSTTLFAYATLSMKRKKNVQLTSTLLLT